MEFVIIVIAVLLMAGVYLKISSSIEVSVATTIAALTVIVSFVPTFVILTKYLFDSPLPLQQSDYIIFSFISVLVCLLLSVIVYLIMDFLGQINAPIQTVQGIVTNKYFAPSTSSVGVGTAYNASTGMPSTAVVTTNHTSESFTVEVKLENDEIIRHKTNEEYFDSVSVGNQVELSYKLSKYSLQIHWDVAIKNLISIQEERKQNEKVG